MIKLTSFFAAFIFAASTFLVGCGGQSTVYDYDEHEEPCYQNQQPNYQDGDYYVFNCGDRYRRVRRDRIIYVNNPIYIPIITDTDRDSIYRTIPRTRRVDSGVTRSTSVPSTTSPSTTGNPPKSGVTRSTSSGTKTSPSSPTRSTSGGSKPSSSGVSRSTSSKR